MKSRNTKEENLRNNQLTNLVVQVDFQRMRKIKLFYKTKFVFYFKIEIFSLVFKRARKVELERQYKDSYLLAIFFSCQSKNSIGIVSGRVNLQKSYVSPLNSLVSKFKLIFLNTKNMLNMLMTK